MKMSDFLDLTIQDHKFVLLKNVPCSSRQKNGLQRRVQDQGCLLSFKRRIHHLTFNKPDDLCSKPWGNRTTQRHEVGPPSRGLGTPAWQSCWGRTSTAMGLKSRTATPVGLEGKPLSQTWVILRLKTSQNLSCFLLLSKFIHFGM